MSFHCTVIFPSIKLNQSTFQYLKYSNMLHELTISRILLVWLTILLTFICIMSYHKNMIIGPSDSLVIFGAMINTDKKYAAVIVLCVFNSAIRVMNMNIIHAWVINHIQDTKIYYKVNPHHAYEITAVHAVYGFVDWYFYMNIILSQIDLFMVEMVVDLCMAILTTRYYLNIKSEMRTAMLTDSDDLKNYVLTSQVDVDRVVIEV